MKTIISASRRTDIPAFYLTWLREVIRQGSVDVPNPFNRNQVRRISLQPEAVGWLVFWSRNYGAFLKQRRLFDSYRLFFHFTINPENELLEPAMIAPAEAWRQLEQLAKLYGPEVIAWRYDPVVHYSSRGKIASNHQLKVFSGYLKKAADLGLTRCIISIAHLYPKVLHRVSRIPDLKLFTPAAEEVYRLLQEMQEQAEALKIQLLSCSNDLLLGVRGIKKGSCIDGRLLNRLSGGEAVVSEKTHHIRPDCGCTVSTDIGDYLRTPCKYRCVYCYARR